MWKGESANWSSDYKCKITNNMKHKYKNIELPLPYVIYSNAFFIFLLTFNRRR